MSTLDSLLGHGHEPLSLYISIRASFFLSLNEFFCLSEIPFSLFYGLLWLVVCDQVATVFHYFSSKTYNLGFDCLELRTTFITQKIILSVRMIHDFLLIKDIFGLDFSSSF